MHLYDDIGDTSSSLRGSTSSLSLFFVKLLSFLWQVFGLLTTSIYYFPCLVSFFTVNVGSGLGHISCSTYCKYKKIKPFRAMHLTFLSVDILFITWDNQIHELIALESNAYLWKASCIIALFNFRLGFEKYYSKN